MTLRIVGNDVIKMNIDAIVNAANTYLLGRAFWHIGNNYTHDSEETALNYELLSEVIGSVRGSAPLNTDCKKRIKRTVKR